MPCSDAGPPDQSAQLHHVRTARLLCQLLRTGLRTPDHDVWLIEHRERDKQNSVIDAQHGVSHCAHRIRECALLSDGHALLDAQIAYHRARQLLEAIQQSDAMTTDLY